jgi:hypothetical protein
MASIQDSLEAIKSIKLNCRLKECGSSFLGVAENAKNAVFPMFE